MNIGYIRVSKNEQNQDLQKDAITKAGCELIFTEKISGASKVRPQFEAMLSQLRNGNTVVV
jgi:DNA invertase Pin-like site-specific DNA recombinase